MNVLVVNAGSSSLKYQLLDTDTREVFAKGNCERIGSDMGIFGHSENGGAKQTEEVPFPDRRSAIARVLEELEKTDFTIDGIGHRIVQGGWHFDDSAVVDDEVMATSLRWPRSPHCTITARPRQSNIAARSIRSCPTWPSSTPRST